MIRQAPLSAIVCAGIGFAVATWYYSGVLALRNERIELLGQQLSVAKGAPQQLKSPPDFRLSMLGANIFVPDQVTQPITGIALDVRIMNAGVPSIATDWNLVVTEINGHTINAQLTRVPNRLTLNGKGGKVAIRDTNSLDVLAYQQPIQTGKGVEGTLLFYVKVPKSDVLQSTFHLSVKDVTGKEVSATQYVRDWMNIEGN